MGHVTFEQFGQVHKAPSNTEPVFANNTWAQIVKACQNNTVPDTWAVGNQKSMTIGEDEYVFTIIGKNHDVDEFGDAFALTLQMQDCLSTTYMMNSTRTNVGGWYESEISYTLDDMVSLLPTEVSAAIVRRFVAKATSAGNKSSTIETTQNSLWLLSEVEVFGTSGNSFAGEGTQYAYYAAGNSKVKKVGSSAKAWWLRSPDSATNTRFCRVSDAGAAGDYYANTSYGISFAFCL